MAGAPEPTLIGQFRFTRGRLFRVLASATLLTVTLLLRGDYSAIVRDE